MFFFLKKLETKMLDHYEKKTKLQPFICIKYINDMFFIWNNGEDSLKDFTQLCNNYSIATKMKSIIRYESNSSKESMFWTFKLILSTIKSKPKEENWCTLIFVQKFLPPSSCDEINLLEWDEFVLRKKILIEMLNNFSNFSIPEYT